MGQLPHHPQKSEHPQRQRHPHPARDQELWGHYSVSPHQGLGVGEDAKGLKKKPLLPSKTTRQSPVPGGEGWEMPGAEQQEKGIWERTCFSSGLVGEGRISRRCGEGDSGTFGEGTC